MNTGAFPDPSPTVMRASFQMTARVLGPVEQDDSSDIRITLRETEGVDATLNFVRLICSDGSAQEWGAGGFVEEFGSNIIPANGSIRFERHYDCPSSGRPFLVRAELLDRSGVLHTVETTPFHPDWPG